MCMCENFANAEITAHVHVLKVNVDQRYRLTAYHCYARVCLAFYIVCLFVVCSIAHELFRMLTDIRLRVCEIFLVYIFKICLLALFSE